MKYNLSLIAVLLATSVNAAPAPEVVTVTQLDTQVINTDGSIYTLLKGIESDLLGAAATTAVPVVTSTQYVYPTPTAAAAAPVTTTAKPASSGGWLNSVVGWLGKLGSGKSSAAATTPAATYAAATSAYSYKPSSPTSSKVPTSKATGSSSSGSISGVEDETFSQQILDAHNEKRALHSAPALTWNSAAYQYAQAYADKYDCSGVLTHSHGQYGENLAAGYNTGPAALDAWYDEGTSYSYSAANTYDHFTQVVWVSTTSVGCAYKDCSATGWGKYIICSYDPAGNVIGQNAANVLAN